MADSASDREMESDASSIDGASAIGPSKQSPAILMKRIESLTQENKVLRMEVETLKLKNKSLQAENKELRQASVNIVSEVLNIRNHWTIMLSPVRILLR